MMHELFERMEEALQQIEWQNLAWRKWNVKSAIVLAEPQRRPFQGGILRTGEVATEPPYGKLEALLYLREWL
jgi:hypothetical protein